MGYLRDRLNVDSGRGHVDMVMVDVLVSYLVKQARYREAQELLNQFDSMVENASDAKFIENTRELIAMHTAAPRIPHKRFNFEKYSKPFLK